MRFLVHERLVLTKWSPGESYSHSHWGESVARGTLKPGKVRKVMRCMRYRSNLMNNR